LADPLSTSSTNGGPGPKCSERRGEEGSGKMGLEGEDSSVKDEN
jgi:hypothetical protein